MEEMKERMKGDLESRYEDPEFSLFLKLCLFLDPRFKGHCFRQKDLSEARTG